ncbi:hypothetical protein RB595_003497 [Gaeumannomyces hyphopodioides]
MVVAEDIGAAASLPYHEPNIAQILVMASFLVVLNGFSSVIDRILYCGLIGQVLIGIAWGTPGAQWLASTLSSSTAASEHVIVQLGYLGLILLVYEGGVSTSIAALKANLFLAVTVAVTGIATPIGLSFILGPLVGASALQCFAAGAALCSTSLGTTFTILSTSGLSATRLGSVLSTAAMMDDVVGLVMVQVVSSLGSAGDGGAADSSVSVEPVTILRPVLVSITFAVVIPLANRYLLRPAMRHLDDKEEKVHKQEQPQQGGKNNYNKRRAVIFGVLATREGALIIHTALLLGLVAAAAYAGASVLLAAYLAGIMVCWWDAERETRRQQVMPSTSANGESSPAGNDGHAQDEHGRNTSTLSITAQPAGTGDGVPPSASTTLLRKSEHTGVFIYEHYYGAAVRRILKPFFFASIGFSIPVTKMFSGPIVWKGLIYTILMMLSKVICGLWLVRLPGRGSGRGGRGRLSFLSGAMSSFTARLSKVTALVSSRGKITTIKASPAPATTGTPESSAAAADNQSPPAQATPSGMDNISMPTPAAANTTASPARPSSFFTPAAAPSEQNLPPAKPISLYPAGIISFAMVARGEIGFLISAVAESKGIFSPAGGGRGGALAASSSSPGEPSDIFLIATWAIMLCTIIGPLAVGVLVKRIKKLEAKRRCGSDEAISAAAVCHRASEERHHDHVLGTWGV